MAFFARGPDPGPFSDYRQYKPSLRTTFRYQCAYCGITEGYRRGTDVFGADHYRPRHLFPQLVCEWANLYYCCLGCNSRKGTRWPDDRLRAKGFEFIDPCKRDPQDGDWRENAEGHLIAESPAGEYSIQVAGLNREECIRFRQRRAATAARLSRCRALINSLTGDKRIAELARNALRDAEALWEECYGELPFLR